MGSLYQINVTELEDIIGGAEYGGSVQPPAGYTGYAVVDSGSNIRSAPTSDLQLFYVYEYESNHGPLAFTAAQAATLVSEVEYVKHSVSFSAPQGDSVGVSDNLQNLATLTSDDVSELNSLGLSITAVDTAGDIETVPLGELETLGQGVTFQADDTSVELSAALATVFAEEGDTVSAPSGHTVTVDDNAAYISALTPTELDAIGSIGVTAIVATNVDPISVSYYQNNLFGTQSTAPAPYTSYGISDTAIDIEGNTAAGIEGLTPEQIAAMPAAGVYSVTATDTSLVLTAAQAVAFENAHIILNVPQNDTTNDTITVVDTAANLEALTTTQMAGLGALGISSIAASDTLPVFSLAQMSALDTVGTTYTGQAYSGVAVLVTPDNPIQNDGTSVVTGPNGSNGLTFDITWDASVASAPANFKTDIEEAFQFYADEFDNPITLYYDVGFGEVDGTAMERGANGESSDNYEPAGTWSYSQLLTALQNDAQSAAQKMAVQSLPSTDPTGGANLIVRDSEALALGLPGAPVDSASSPDAEIGLTDGPPIGPSTDPDQGPSNTSEIDLISTAEHEIAEGMGRVSEVNTAATTYSPIDLFRFSGKNARALTPVANPSYFSIDDGATPLSEWNNYSAGNNGDDLGDWAENVENANPYEVDNPPSPNSSTPAGYTYDSYNAASPGGTLNPITAPDVTLMNVLGYDLASPWITLPLPSTDIEITAGQMLVDLVMNQIDPGSANPPAGDSYVVVDNLLDVQSLTPAEIAGASSIGVSSVFAVATAAQAVTQEGFGPSPLPLGATGILYDTAANIEGLTPDQITLLPTVGISEIESSDASLSLTWAQATAVEGAGISVVVPPGDNVTIAVPDDSKLFFDGTDANDNVGLWVSDGTAGGTHELVGVDGIAGATVDASDITALGNKLVVFNGSDPYGNDGLWVSSGTADGTYELAGIANADPSGLDPQDMTVVGNEIWFEGLDANGQPGLWETDGTAVETLELVPGLSIPGPVGTGDATTVVAYDNGIVFQGSDGGLWESDGTPTGTHEIITPGQYLGDDPVFGPLYAASDFDPAGFTVDDGIVVFDGRAYSPTEAADTGGSGLIEALFTFNGASVQEEASTGLAAGSDTQPPHVGMSYGAPVTLFDSLGNYTPYVVDTPPTGPGQAGYVTDAVFFQVYGNPGEGLAYYEPSTGAGGEFAGYSAGFVETAGFSGPAYTYIAGGPDPNDIVGVGGVLLFNMEGLQSSAGYLYGDFTLGLSTGPATGPTDVSPFPLVDLSSYISGGNANGINPTDITAFDGDAYFSGDDSAGDQGLFELQPEGQAGFVGFNITTGAPYIEANGFEFTGISGAGPNGINPNNLTALSIPAYTADAITVAELLQILADPAANPPPANETYLIMDSAANVETLTPDQISAAKAIGVSTIVTGTITLSVEQAEALEDPLKIVVPAGDAVILSGSADAIAGMTVAQMSALASIGVTEIEVSGGSITLAAPQAAALASVSIQISAPSGSVDIADIYSLTAAAIETMSLTQAKLLVGLDYRVLMATDAPVALMAAQAAMFESLGLLVGTQQGSVTISDSAGDIASLTPTEFAGLANLGVSAITATDTSVYLTVAQALALESTPVPITALQGEVFVAVTAANIDDLTPAQILALPSIGVNAITESPITAILSISVAQALALEQSGIHVGPLQTGPNLSGLGFQINDAPDAIQSLSPDQIAGLRNIGPTFFNGLGASGSVTFDIVQALALANAGIYVGVPPHDTVTIADTADKLALLTAPQIDALRPWLDGYVPYGAGPTITATSGPVVICAAAAAALEGDNPLVSYLDGGTLISIVLPVGETTMSVQDTAAQIELLTPTQLQALASLQVGAITATDASLALTVAQAEAIATYLFNVDGTSVDLSVPTGDIITIADIPSNIKAFLDQSSDAIASVAELNHVSGIAADGALALNVSEAEALEGASAYLAKDIAITAPDGGVTLTGTAAQIEAMSPQQLSALTSIGVGTIDVSDQSLTLNVQQALALFDPVPIYVPPGHTVIVAGTESEIDSLTPTEISQLAAIGVTTVEVSNLTGAGPLTINGGITLSISGAVPSNETITFAGTGGTLALDDTAAMAGTIYGFSPPDTIDLTDIPFDTSGNSYAYLGTDPNGNPAIEFYDNDNGNTYSLDIDPSQVFPTGATFNLAQDASGNGTDLSVSEPALTFESVDLNYSYGGQPVTVDGVVVGADGVLEVDNGDTVNRAVVQSGGEVIGEYYSTINDTFVDGGGLLDLVSASVGSGAIDFGPIVDGVGGTLEIDDQSTLAATITGFTVGDTIDLTAIPYDPTGEMVPDGAGGNLWDVDENGSQYQLQFDPSQDFLNQTFVLSPDLGSGTDITLQQTPIDTAVSIPSGQAVYGALVGSGGSVDVQAAATFNYGVINDGGLVNVQTGGSLGSGIDFGTEGGTLTIDGSDLYGTANYTFLLGTTIYGFAPNDTIDLPDVAYDASGSAELGSDPNDNYGPAIVVTEAGTTYYLDIDPSQVFPTLPAFQLSQDAGTGTDLTVTEPPLTNASYYVGFVAQTVDGLVIASGGYLEAEFNATVNDATVTGGGELKGDFDSAINDASIDSGGLVDLVSAAAGSGDITFDTGGTLEIDDTAPLNATIDGFAPGDTIDLTAISYDPDGSANLVAGNVLDINENGSTYTLQFDPTQDFSGDYFHLAPDNAGTGTDITENTSPCYCPGTLIRTKRGEQPVESLKIGDEIMTASGRLRPIKWIGRRSYSGRFVMGRKDILPVCIKAGALDDNVPGRDLWISPHHAMYFKEDGREGALIEAKDLVNGVSIVQAQRVERVEYFHIELGTHDVIIAEGARSESFIDDDSRFMFHNAHQYRALYPDAVAGPAQYCAPRYEDGYELEAVRRRIALRAGLVGVATAPRLGALRGNVDCVNPRCIEGWAQNVDHPEAPVCLDILVGGRLIGQTLANRYREDLKQAGLSSGGHAFSFTPPENLFCTSGAVEVRRSLDGVALKLSIATQQALRRRLSPPARATSEGAALSPLSTAALGA